MELPPLIDHLLWYTFRLILPYERFIKGEEDKPLPPIKPRKQENSSQENENKTKISGTKRIKHEIPKSKKEKENAPKSQDASEVSCSPPQKYLCEPGPASGSPRALHLELCPFIAAAWDDEIKSSQLHSSPKSGPLGLLRNWKAMHGVEWDRLKIGSRKMQTSCRKLLANADFDIEGASASAVWSQRAPIWKMGFLCHFTTSLSEEEMWL